MLGVNMLLKNKLFRGALEDGLASYTLDGHGSGIRLQLGLVTLPSGALGIPVSFGLGLSTVTHFDW